MVDLTYLKGKVFPGESGGDYNALFGYVNRGSGPFGGVKVTDMTINQVLDFTAPSGPYAQSVKGQIGRVATPTGAYQVVGRTLRDAVRGLGLTGDEIYNEGTQDRIGQWIYENQGPQAWEAWGKGGGGGGDMVSGGGGGDMVSGGAGSDGLLGGAGNDTGGGPAMENEQGGLFGFLGDREQRARLGLALMGMSMHPNEGAMAMMRDTIAQAQAAREKQYAQAQIDQQTNKTVEYIRNLNTPQAKEALDYFYGTGDIVTALNIARQQAEPVRGIEVDGRLVNPLTGEILYEPPTQAAPPPAAFAALDMQARASGLVPKSEGGDGRYEEFMLSGGAGAAADAAARAKAAIDSQTPPPPPAAFAALDMQARASGLVPKSEGGDGRYEEFMLSGGAGAAAEAAARARAAIDREANAPNMQAQAATAQSSLDLINSVMESPYLNSVTGMLQGRMPPLTQGGTDLTIQIEQLQGQAFLQAFESLKGGGAITEVEGRAATNAIARLNRAQSGEAFKQGLRELQAIYQRAIDRINSGSLVQPLTGSANTGTDYGDVTVGEGF